MIALEKTRNKKRRKTKNHLLQPKDIISKDSPDHPRNTILANHFREVKNVKNNQNKNEKNQRNDNKKNNFNFRNEKNEKNERNEKNDFDKR